LAATATLSAAAAAYLTDSLVASSNLESSSTLLVLN